MIRIFVYSFATFILAIVARATDPTAYVANSTGETISKVNLSTGAVDINKVVLGSAIGCAPNQIVVRDTMAYVINSVCDEIQLINLKTESTVGFYDMPTGSNPYWMEFYNDRYVYVTLLMYRSIVKLDVETGSIVHADTVGLSPGGIVISNHKAYVGITAMDDEYQYGQGKVAVYDCRTDILLKQLNVGTNPNNLAVDSAGRVHVVCSGDYSQPYGYVYIIETNTDTIIESLNIGGTGLDTPGPISIGPDNVAYVAAGGWGGNGKLYAYDAHTLEIFNGVSNPIHTNIGCMGVQTFQDSSSFAISFYDFMERLDTSGVITDSYPVGSGPVHIGFNYVPGDIDGSFEVDGIDLSMMIDMLFISLQEPTFLKWRANVNGDFGIDGIDLAILINSLFINPGAPMSVGPTWLK